MDIRRISESLIRCTINKDELIYEYGIDVNFSNNEIMDSIREHINDIILKCLEEEDVVPSSSVINASITLTKNYDLILDINLDGNSKMNSFGHGKPLTPTFGNEELEDNPFLNFLKDFLGAVDKKQEVEEQKVENYDEPIDEKSIYGFDTLDMVINFSKIIKEIEIDSMLYKLDNRYFLYLDKHIKKIDNLALEFGGTNNSHQNGFINEHGDVLIKKDAIKNLATL